MKERLQKHRTCLLLAVYAAAVLCMAYSFAVTRTQCSDYVSIDGDFQSYNVFRRILAGQLPYRDFANYIGMAPVVCNLPFLALHNSFTASLFVTNFTACVLFCAAVLLLIYLTTASLPLACLVSALLPKFVHSQILLRLLGARYGTALTELFEGLYTPGNSMRVARSFLPFLLTTAAGLCLRLLRRRGRKADILPYLSRPRFMTAAGFVLGLFVVWSNDYGLACPAALAVLMIVCQIAVNRAPVRQFLAGLVGFAAAAAVGVLVSAALCTGGHPGAWFAATGQTAAYQFFYFNGSEGKAIVPYIFTTPRLLAVTAAYLAVLVFYLVRLVRGKAQNRDVGLVFILLSLAAGTYAYVCGGSGYHCPEPIEGYGLVMCLGFLCAGLRRIPHAPAAATAALVLLAGYYGRAAITLRPEPEGFYSEALQGYTTYEKALVGAAEATDGEPVFSLYATGLELAKGQFQPTGYDYIIHALGADARQRYCRQFLDGDYTYVQVPSLSVNVWLANQNWDLYRYILNGYEPYYDTEYSHILKKTDAPAPQAEVTVQAVQRDDGAWELRCQSSRTDCFVADVQITYDTAFADFGSALLALGRRAVTADTTCCAQPSLYYGLALPAAGTQNIPVLMQNGTGTAVLRGAYGKGVTLQLHSAVYQQAVRPLAG